MKTQLAYKTAHNCAMSQRNLLIQKNTSYTDEITALVFCRQTVFSIYLFTSHKHP